ncbi:MAG: type II toxin-antitoxin system HicB family antitoxin [Anaerolineae bacterium]|nr:type II toxin-antitoxin system HicB family antitoxin [Anaerolineae bacterium]
MSRLAVYLEIDDDGRCMAHVPELPGCFVRASSCDRALDLMLAAIRIYYAWLRSHGEPAPPEEVPVEIKVAGEVSGVGPFDPGSAAALFPPDQGEATPGEMAYCFRLMAHSRADLLASVHALPGEVLDWQQQDAFSIRRLLRHVGDAEEWYVSRIVPPETLPPEWEHDEGLPIFEFLEMERRTAVERMKQLTRTERTKVFYPTRWTGHPEEPWTARKALRRFLEHEREHTVQAQELLLAWWGVKGRKAKTGSKEALLAVLSAAREGLLRAAALVPMEERVSRHVCGEWALQDVLGHMADWEWVGVEGLRLMAAGRPPRVEHIESLDAWNQAHCEARRDQPWGEVWDDFHAAREAMVAVLSDMSQDDLARSFIFPWGQEGTAYQWVGVYVTHDWEHALDLKGA